MARQHSLQYGRGALPARTKSPRMRVDNKQLDHFLTYITSPHVIQDLPFGQRYLRLSSGKILETPNVIRAMIPNRLVKQYQAYCEETNFTPFSPTTMLRVLSACRATVRKSLQGLDYIASDRAKGLERHMSFGKCKLIPEKETLLDRAKLTYHAILQDDIGIAKVFEGRETEKKHGVSLPEGHKQNPEKVARDTRFAKKADGSRLFSSDEFLTSQQIQSFFSRLSCKLRHAVEVSDSDLQASQDEQEFCDTRQTVLEEVQLEHPIAYDNLNLCELTKKGNMKTLSIAMLKNISYFDICTEEFNPRRKA
ncbi:unnamed protein product [Porites lobata]|uniref:Uncharacterized protein n=1 Tax=Porites lobata TaxID=104759 RepID=A0ABN8PJ04_9CNID|nr:unnamed protein product [Porites lobata]